MTYNVEQFADNEVEITCERQYCYRHVEDVSNQIQNNKQTEYLCFKKGISDIHVIQDMVNNYIY